MGNFEGKTGFRIFSMPAFFQMNGGKMKFKVGEKVETGFRGQ